jgi:ATP/maltotriose-dependent transcriptional regulator MalT
VVVFAAYLAEALHALSAAAGGLLNAVSGVTHRRRLCWPNLLNDLADIEQDFILVLDDYHFIHSQAICDLLTGWCGIRRARCAWSLPAGMIPLCR